MASQLATGNKSRQVVRSPFRPYCAFVVCSRFLSRVSSEDWTEASTTHRIAETELHSTRPYLPQSIPQFQGQELRTLIGANVFRGPSSHRHIRQGLLPPPCHPKSQAFSRVFVDQ